ncbi:MAG: hypothetical protein HC915_03965, partial [Anaerolineae bacterium]|nr:hypothetical protein [Anaerolineae bacterium]
LDRHMIAPERFRLASRAMLGLMIAGAFTVVVFRFLQPHAFEGPTVFGVIPNDGWLEDISEAQRLVSGAVDIPPNHQWADRTPWLYPWQNMVLWGMGPALGLAGWGAVLWALWIIVRGRPGWTRLALLAAWIAVYFGWLGGNWVTTMRYFLPIYAPLALLAGWMLLEIPRRLWLARQQPTLRRGAPRWVRQGLLAGSVAAVLLVSGYTAAYGYGMTSIYRNVLTRVGVSLWFQENVPGNLGLWIEEAEGGYSLQNVDTGLAAIPFYVVSLPEEQPIVQSLSIPTDTVVQSVVLHRLGDPQRDPDPEQVVVRLVFNNGFAREVIAEEVLTADLTEGFSDFGGEYSIPFNLPNGDPLLLRGALPGVGLPAPYEVEIEVLDGPVTLSRNVSDAMLPISLHHISVYLEDTTTQTQTIQGFSLDDGINNTPYTYFLPGQPAQVAFRARASGTIRQIEFPHLGDPFSDADEETMRVQILGPEGALQPGALAAISR